VLPEHERAKCLAHLAECSRCREIVFLAQDTPLAPAKPVLVPAPARRQFRIMPLLAAAAAVFITLLGAWLFLHFRTEAPPSEEVTRVSQPPSSPPPENPTQIPPSPPRPELHNQPAPKSEKPSPYLAKGPETARPPAAPSPPESATTNPPAVVQTEVAGATGISGTVTDASGGAIPSATVQLHQLGGNSIADARTDQAGHFKFPGLAPGQYELQITAPGFRRTSQRVQVQPQEVASVKSELQVGSVSETVEVNASGSTLQTDSAQVSTVSKGKKAAPAPQPLPSKLPAETMVRRDKVVLAVDSAGALWFSGNRGKSWKAVKPTWSGKVDELLTPPDLPQAGKAKFQLTTDAGSNWLSRDGRRWYPASSPR